VNSWAKRVEVTAVKRYRLIPEAFEQERSRLSRGFYAAYLISVLAAMIFAGARYANFKPGLPLLTTLMGFTLALVFTVSLAFWAMFRSLRLRRQEWQSYELEWYEDKVVRHLADTNDLEIMRSEITGFDETAGRGFYIKTDDVHRFIFVPSALDGYEELKRKMEKWRLFPPARAREPIWRSPFFISSVCLLAWFVLWFSVNKQQVLAAGFVLLVFLLSTFVAVVRSPRSSLTMKRMSWIFLLVAGLALVRVASVMRITE
jgi:drug/metabolite transporter (DMT)-like permease